MAEKTQTQRKNKVNKKNREQDLRTTFIKAEYKASGKLQDQVAIITGGDSGIGRAVALHFAKEGAHVVIVYHQSDEDAKETAALIKENDRKCLLQRSVFFKTV